MNEVDANVKKDKDPNYVKGKTIGEFMSSDELLKREPKYSSKKDEGVLPGSS